MLVRSVTAFFKAHLVADFLAQPHPLLLRDPPGQHARGDPARLQHHDLALRGPTPSLSSILGIWVDFPEPVGASITRRRATDGRGRTPAPSPWASDFPQFVNRQIVHSITPGGLWTRALHAGGTAPACKEALCRPLAFRPPNPSLLREM